MTEVKSPRLEGGYPAGANLTLLFYITQPAVVAIFKIITHITVADFAELARFGRVSAPQK